MVGPQRVLQVVDAKELTWGKLQPGLKMSQVPQVTPLSSSVLGG